MKLFIKLITLIFLSLTFTQTQASLKIPIEKIKDVAEQGNTEAQYNLAMMYLRGWGTKQNFEEAFKWLKTAVEQGHNGAQFRLALMYLSGEGTEQNINKAFQLLKTAAKQGDAQAQLFLGITYLHGESGKNGRIKVNLKKALKLIKTAAKQGDVQAQLELARMYYEGDGFIRNAKKAFLWFKKAAEQGNTEAQYQLGWMYLHGDEGTDTYLPVEDGEEVKVPKQALEQAFLWFKKVAEQGSIEAQEDLIDAQLEVARMYYYGNGTEQNLEKALYWAEKLLSTKDPNFHGVGAHLYYIQNEARYLSVSITEKIKQSKISKCNLAINNLSH